MSALKRRVVLGLAGLLVVPVSIVLIVRMSERSREPSSTERAVATAASKQPEHRPSDLIAASDALAVKDPAASRAVLRRAIEQDGDDPELLAKLARKLLLDESTEARALAARCLELRPGHGGCDEVYRRALDPVPRDDRTSKFLDGCLAADGERVPCLAAMLVDRLRKGDLDGAAEVGQRLEAVSPTAPLTSLSNARVFSARRQYAAALASFDAACAAGESYGCFRAEALRAEGW